MAGERPGPVRDLHQFVGAVLTASEIDHEDAVVLAITHGRLVRLVSDLDDPPYATAYEVPNGWTNPEYSPDFARVMMANPELWLGEPPDPVTLRVIASLRPPAGQA